MIKTLFSSKGTYRHKDETNWKTNEAIKKIKTISQDKFNEHLKGEINIHID